MPRRGGWRRLGRAPRFRYVDARGSAISREELLERIDSLVIPPAWKDVWISPNPRAKLQATGVDAAGRTQYLYHPAFRAAQERAKFDRLVRFAELASGLACPGSPRPSTGPVRARLGPRDRRDARQPRLVPRRQRPPCARGPYLRGHDTPQAACAGPGRAADVLLSDEEPGTRASRPRTSVPGEGPSPRRSRWPSTDPPGTRPKRSASSPPSCASWARSSGTRPLSHALPM
jgi:hypothetical protein